MLLAYWPLAQRLPTIADSLVHLVFGTPQYEMIINIIKHLMDLQRIPPNRVHSEAHCTYLKARYMDQVPTLMMNVDGTSVLTKTTNSDDIVGLHSNAKAATCAMCVSQKSAEL